MKKKVKPHQTKLVNTEQGVRLKEALNQPEGKGKLLSSYEDKEVDHIMVMRRRSIDLNSVLEDWVAASKQLFPKATSVGGMLHAKRECDEVIEIINPLHKDHSRSLLAEEYADILMCTFDSMERAGIDIMQICESIIWKTAINKERKWKDNGDGSYSHIKTK